MRIVVVSQQNTFAFCQSDGIALINEEYQEEMQQKMFNYLTIYINSQIIMC